MRIFICVETGPRSFLIGIKDGDRHFVVECAVHEEALGALAGMLYGDQHRWVHDIESPLFEWALEGVVDACEQLRAIDPSWPMPTWHEPKALPEVAS